MSSRRAMKSYQEDQAKSALERGYMPDHWTCPQCGKRAEARHNSIDRVTYKHKTKVKGTLGDFMWRTRYCEVVK